MRRTEALKRLKKNRIPLLWIKGYFEPAHYEVAENITYDEKMHSGNR